MHVRHFAVLVILAASSHFAAAHLVAPAEDLAPRAGFLKTGMVVLEQPAPPATAPAASASCRGSTFSELGHGHPDVASAGFAAAHCPPLDESIAADAALAPAH